MDVVRQFAHPVGGRGGTIADAQIAETLHPHEDMGLAAMMGDHHGFTRADLPPMGEIAHQFGGGDAPPATIIQHGFLAPGSCQETRIQRRIKR